MITAGHDSRTYIWKFGLTRGQIAMLSCAHQKALHDLGCDLFALPQSCSAIVLHHVINQFQMLWTVGMQSEH